MDRNMIFNGDHEIETILGTERGILPRVENIHQKGWLIDDGIIRHDLLRKTVLGLAIRWSLDHGLYD